MPVNPNFLERLLLLRLNKGPGAGTAIPLRYIGAAAVELLHAVVRPVRHVDIVAGVDGDAVRLTWSTASETNNAGFEVQRSENGKKCKAAHISLIQECLFR